MIREATREDAPAIVDILAALHEITSFAPVDFSEVKAKHAVVSFIEGGQFARVIDLDGEIAGVMIGIVFPTWFGSDLIAVDIALYVKPECRGFASVRLVKQFIAWAKDKGAKQIRPGISTGDKSGGRIYRSLSFKDLGESFYLTL